ncbi:MAG: hypothetical protein RR214_07435 [Synergistaceae bacterium]
MLLFVTCGHCGKKITDEDTLITVKYDIWTCPECGAENPPLNSKIPDAFDSTEGELPEEITDSKEKVISII